ncbi:hypothetical protein N9933_03515 [bacterium]|nr:hypothetical protein [bacterium]
MKELFSDIEDLACVLEGKENAFIKAAIEIVYLKGKLDGYTNSVDRKGGQIQDQISFLEQRIDVLIIDIENQILGLS